MKKVFLTLSLLILVTAAWISPAEANGSPPVFYDLQGTTMSYTENQAAKSCTNGAVPNTFSSSNVLQATITISNNYENGADVLSFGTYGNITGSFEQGTGVLTLSGSDTYTNYATAYSQVKYNSTSENPSILDRTLTWTAQNTYGWTASPPTTTVTVAAVNDDPTVDTNTGLTVSSTAATTITSAHLEATDAEQGAAALTFSVTSSSPNGDLKLNTTTLGYHDTFTQDDINNDLLTYTYDGSGDPWKFIFALSDGAGGTISSFDFDLTYVSPPSVTTNETLILTIDPDNIDPTIRVSSSFLETTDPEQAAAELTYTLTSSPHEGILEFTSTPIRTPLIHDGTYKTFTQAEINNNYIDYIFEGTEGATDDFNFTVSDGSLTDSGTFNIIINYMPTLTSFSTAVDTTNEDTEVEITLAELKTQGNEADSDGTVDAFVVQSVSTGSLNIGASSGAATAFAATTNDTIDASNNAYWTPAEDATGTLNAFAVVAQDDDGAESSSNVTATVSVTAQNDDPVVTNNGLTVNEDATGTITSAKLEATDAEQGAASLTFTIGTPLPANGTLKLNGTGLGNTDTFSQNDINNNLLTYEHTGGENVSDSFYFGVSDGVGGSAGWTTFNITVTPQNDTPTLDTNNGLTVSNGATGTITSSLLETTDVEQAAASLTYTLTSSTINGELTNTNTFNELTHTGTNTFTQSDINNNYITYTHSGTATTTDSFNFTVADGAGGTIGTTTFNITINSAPTIAVGNKGYTENADASAIDVSATANDADGNTDWDTGAKLEVQITVNAESADELSIDTSGTLNINSGILDDGQGQTVGTISESSGTANDGTVTAGDKLTVNFASDASNQHVQALVRSILYRSTSDTPTASSTTRTVTFTLTDIKGGSGSDTSTITITPLNDDPTVVTNSTLTVNEGATGTITSAKLQATDPEQGAASLTFALGSTTSYGNLKLNGSTLGSSDTFTQDDIDNNRITYTHNGGETGSDNFTFTLSDGFGLIGTPTFNFSITPLNDPPAILTNSTLTVNEGATGSITTGYLDENDPDDSGDGLTYTVTTIPVNGNLKLDGLTLDDSDTFTQDDIDQDRLSYQHNGSETNSDTFIFSLADGGENSAGAVTGQTFSISVTPQNDPPALLTNSTLTVDEGYSGSITSNLLNENDPDDSGTGLSYTVTALPSYGTVKLSGNDLSVSDTFTQADINNSLITYVNDGSETTADSFTFGLADGGEDNVDPLTGQIFDITVTPVNDAPAILTNSTLTVDEGATGSITTSSLNEDDPDDSGTGLIYTLTSNPINGTLRNGTTVLSTSGSDVTFTQADIDQNRLSYQHNGSETNSDTFTFNLADGGENSAGAVTGQTFSISVTPQNDPPALLTNSTLTVDEGYSGSITSNLLNENDPDDSGTGLSYTVTALPSYGTVKLSGNDLSVSDTFTQADINNSLITYVNDGSETTADSFTFGLADGGEDNVDPLTGQIFDITVTPVNDAPAILTNSTLTVDEGATGSITSGYLNEDDPDDSGTGLMYTLTSNPINGTLRNGTTVLSTSGSDVTFTQADIDQDRLTYQHNGSETNSDTFTFSLADGGENSAAPVTGQTFNISVTAINDEPELDTNQGLTVDEDGSGTISSAKLALSDVDNDPADLTYTITTATAHGDLMVDGSVLDVDGNFTQEDVDNNLLTYDHDGSETTEDSFEFTFSDGEPALPASVNPLGSLQPVVVITINPVNDEPVLATNDGLTVDEGGSGTITSSDLQVTDVEQGAADLTFTIGTYVPVNGTLKLNTTTLTPGDTFTQDDLDNNRITYTHNGGETTDDSFIFMVSDGAEGSISSKTFDITVNPVNDEPELNTNEGLTVDEGDSGTIDGQRLVITDVDNDPADLTYTITTAAAHGDLMVDGNVLGVDGTFTQEDVDNDLLIYEHDGSETTEDSFEFTFSDGEPVQPGSVNPLGSLQPVVVITINPVNDEPVLATNDGLTVDEGGSGTIGSSALLVTDAEQAASSLIFTLGTDPENGTLMNGTTVLSTSGSDTTFTQADIDNGLLVYTHNSSETTGDSFTFTVSDGDGGTIDSTNFSIIVNPVNDEPELETNDGLTVDEGGSGTIGSAKLTLSDPDNDPADLTYTITTATAYGDLMLDGNVLDVDGTFTQENVDNNLLTYEHDGSETTEDSFEFDYSDEQLGQWYSVNSLTQLQPVFIITITPVNDLPVLTNNGLTVDESESATITSSELQMTDAEDGAADLTFTIGTPTTNGTLALNGSALSYEDTFTQDNIDNNLLTYAHNGSDTTADSFTFFYEDSDHAGKAAPWTVTPASPPVSYETFAITINPVNDPPYLYTNEGLTVDEGGSGTIGSTELTVADTDNEPADLTYTVDVTTSYGDLMVDGSVLDVGGTFTQDDIDNNLLIYEHDGSETTEDSFEFDYSDGQQVVPGMVNPLPYLDPVFVITVTPVSDPPVLSAIETTSPQFVNGMDPIQITATLILEDIDSTAFSSAEVAVTGNYHDDEDVLAFAGYQNITAQPFNTTTGVLTLTGSGTLAEYQAALRLVTYENTAQLPSEDTRTVSFTLHDSPENSNVVSRTITIIADIWAPVIETVEVFDDDAEGEAGYGYIDRVVFTYDEELAEGQADISDWILLDADGVTNLLDGLDDSAITIDGNTVTITLADNTGTLGDPFYMYEEDGENGAIQDLYTNEKEDVNNNSDPVAVAGDPQEDVPAVFTLDATGSSDPDNNVITYLWEQVDGPADVEFIEEDTQVDPLNGPQYDTTEDAVTKFIARAHGDYTFRLTVTDYFGATDTDEVIVTVYNVAPVAKAGRDRSLMRDEDTDLDVTLDGSASIDANRTDADPDIVGYLWEQVIEDGSNVAGVTLEVDQQYPTKASIDTSTLPAGTYEFELTVTDGGEGDQVYVGAAGAVVPAVIEYAEREEGLSDTDTVKITVNVPNANVAPTAHAGVNIDQFTNTVLTLTGHESKDTDGDDLTYRWVQVQTGAPTVSFIGGTTSTSVQPKFRPTQAGAYIFELIVNDGFLDSAPDRVEVYILQPAAEFPIADILVEGVRTAVVPLPIEVGDTMTIDGEVLGVADADTVTAQWSQTYGPTYTFADDSSFDQVFTPVNEGVYTFRLDVFQGTLQGRYADISITAVSTDSNPPAAEASDDQTVFVDTVVTLDGSASDEDIDPVDLQNDPTLLDYTWTQKLGPNVPLSDSSVLAPTFTPKQTGVYSFELVAFDGTFESPADTVYITVNSAEQSVPQAVVQEDNIDTEVGSMVVMNGLPSFDPDTNDDDTDDPEDSGEWNLVYQWEKVSGPPAILDNLNSPQPTFIPSTIGIYVFKLYVDDRGNDLSQSANVTVTVGQVGTVREGSHETGLGGGSCFIATAAYGTPFEDDVMTLRRFRDNVLLPSEPGRKLVELYYTYSPPAAATIARDENLRKLVRTVLSPVVRGIELVD